ncbi:hypothetical protein B0H63DRAFT_549154 [Podospora didyma]|uniref:Monooxygenase n=1 Tax=Podospora didyma TaxID=330526 RepID=A0AAE0N8M9_9PEZI|nr:hypothetical protein B0H63DRAFT_549154 [Podospora didyma]
MSSDTSSPVNQDPRFGVGRTVAVIGAGISGVCAAAHLLKHGLQVTVFERSSFAGGVWHFDELVPNDPPYPNNLPSSGDYNVSKPGEFAYSTPPPEPHDDGGDGGALSSATGSKDIVELEVSFSPPGPAYAGLKNNIPTNILVSSLGPWPEGTEPIVGQSVVEEYIQTLARNNGVDNITHFHARVEEARKTPTGVWEIRSVSLEKGESGPRLVERLSYFDLLVVASGHYGMPRVPDIPGLKEWKSAFPSRVSHSKQYRRPNKYQGRNLLVVGAGVSSLDICKELSSFANKIYQSVRGGTYDTPASMLPPNALRVGPPARFDLQEKRREGQQTLGSVVLADGQVLDDITDVILATGYVTSYPFLPQFHSDTASITEAGESLIVTSGGDMAHNLHRDIFYINDPTLAFVGVPYYVSTFSLFDYQSQALARAFAGKARLPSREEMRAEYEDRVKQKGLGRTFHALNQPGHEYQYVKNLVDWVNEDGDKLGETPMYVPTEGWISDFDEFKAKIFKARAAGTSAPEADSTVLTT